MQDESTGSIGSMTPLNSSERDGKNVFHHFKSSNLVLTTRLSVGTLSEKLL